MHVNSWLALREIKYSADKNLIDVTPLTETLAEAVYTPVEERCGFHKNTSSLVYAFVTALGSVTRCDTKMQ